MYQRLPYHGHCCSTRDDIGLNTQPYLLMPTLNRNCMLDSLDVRRFFQCADHFCVLDTTWGKVFLPALGASIFSPLSLTNRLLSLTQPFSAFLSLMPFSASLSRSQSDLALRSLSRHNPYSAWFSLIYPHLIQPRHDPSQVVVLCISSMHPFKFTELDDI